LTFSTPLELKSAGGWWTMLPALKRGQGLETGLTGVTPVPLAIILGAAKALICASMKTHVALISRSDIRRLTVVSPLSVVLNNRPLIGSFLPRAKPA
jgi:hypothetical protein